MNKTQMAVIAGIVLCVIVGCIAGGVFLLKTARLFDACACF